ncbi:hypothetical protein CYMTET_56769 [Cymbomonas tetramitiformis]|uniref:Uncharacterized protein n=1 Tax=Cymbomonas tetramitiformis TaxID=36881 RepID=A0AAE0BBP1_9CHLO|nr:hypothetical protein CYMTET_56769 [Cymbomonas tetramitiformis]
MAVMPAMMKQVVFVLPVVKITAVLLLEPPAPKPWLRVVGMGWRSWEGRKGGGDGGRWAWREHGGGRQLTVDAMITLPLDASVTLTSFVPVPAAPAICPRKDSKKAVEKEELSKAARSIPENPMEHVITSHNHSSRGGLGGGGEGRKEVERGGEGVEGIGGGEVGRRGGGGTGGGGRTRKVPSRVEAGAPVEVAYTIVPVIS